ncbi:hypothetical protein LIER_26183 [Lithospermum erythrorhizon]|uniref:Gag-pol polyprotein n=1 Tax=Lithospermum erythrorhizon TaxID=34254 RepID=A0AAV3RBG1_LITER
MARVMPYAKKIPVRFWAEVVNTACYIHNRITLQPGTNNTTYEIWRGRKPNVKYFHIFGSVCYILVHREQRQKFDVKGDEGIFLGYSRNSRALRVYNKRTQIIMESINVKVVDQHQSLEEEEEELSVTTLVIDTQGDQTIEGDNNITPIAIDNSIEPAARIQKTHLVSNIIGETDRGMTTRNKDKVDYRKMARLFVETFFLSNFEPKDVKATLQDENWINAMQEELVQFQRNDVWELVSRPKDHNVIGTKWIFKNTFDELGNAIRVKARVVAQG